MSSKGEMKDYFKILGLERGASVEEVKKTYRKLAREFHPDVNKAEDAEEKFKDISEAYQVLTDENARAMYEDMWNREGERSVYKFVFQDVFDLFFGRRPSANQPINGENLYTTVEFLVQEALHPDEKIIDLRRRRTCPDCLGKTFIVDERGVRCPDCDGSGHIPKVKVTAFGRIETADPCATCGGNGRLKTKPCYTCEQTGLVPNDSKLAIVLPNNLRDGLQVKYEGLGEGGKDGGKNGDLYVTFKHAAHDRWKIENKFDVITKQYIDLKQALVGDTVTVIAPDGMIMGTPVFPGTNTGDRTEIAKHGLYDDDSGRHGQCYVEFHVNVPRNLSSANTNKIAKILDQNTTTEG